jgi:VanZ family protein
MKPKPSFIPAVLWLVISTVLLTLPGSDLPKEDWLGKIGFDKWVHIGMFSIMVVLWCRAMLRVYKEGKQLKNTFLLLGLLWLGFGVGMEFVQKYFIPGRSFDVKDMIADAAGCTVGVVYSIVTYIKKIDPCGNRGRNQN